MVQERFEKARPPSWNLIRPRKGFGGNGDLNGRYAAIRGSAGRRRLGRARSCACHGACHRVDCLVVLLAAAYDARKGTSRLVAKAARLWALPTCQIATGGL